jgi:hypothetical protein
MSAGGWRTWPHPRAGKVICASPEPMWRWRTRRSPGCPALRTSRRLVCPEPDDRTPPSSLPLSNACPVNACPAWRLPGLALADRLRDLSIRASPLPGMSQLHPGIGHQEMKCLFQSGGCLVGTIDAVLSVLTRSVITHVTQPELSPGEKSGFPLWPECDWTCLPFGNASLPDRRLELHGSSSRPLERPSARALTGSFSAVATMTRLRRSPLAPPSRDPRILPPFLGSGPVRRSARPNRSRA